LATPPGINESSSRSAGSVVVPGDILLNLAPPLRRPLPRDRNVRLVRSVYPALASGKPANLHKSVLR
jgi:hypothetical protein